MIAIALKGNFPPKQTGSEKKSESIKLNYLLTPDWANFSQFSSKFPSFRLQLKADNLNSSPNQTLNPFSWDSAPKLFRRPERWSGFVSKGRNGAPGIEDVGIRPSPETVGRVGPERKTGKRASDLGLGFRACDLGDLARTRRACVDKRARLGIFRVVIWRVDTCLTCQRHGHGFRRACGHEILSSL